MKKGVTIGILVIIVFVFGGSLYYLYNKNKQSPVVFQTEKSEVKTIVKKTIATGNIVPKEEVNIKPNISGIIQEILVKAGDFVKAGDVIAKVRVVPSIDAMNNSKNQVETAKINLENQTKLYNRQKSLYQKGVIATNEFDSAELAYSQAKQNYAAAVETYEIIKTGTTSGLGLAANTIIKSPVAGMILDVPVRIGTQVIQANNFNEGTTIASIADVGKLIFKGKVDESEVGKIKEKLPLEVTVGAIENKVFEAVLDYIAPKGKTENGAIQFEIEGTLINRDSTFIRSGLSANASIILQKVENVLALKESLIQFEDKTQKPFVEIEIGSQKYEKKYVELGLSDGIYVQIKSGVTNKDKIKIWNQTQSMPPQ
jgi:HlyD family secretion protein